MMLSCTIIVVTRRVTAAHSLHWWATPEPTHALVQALVLVQHMWSYLLTISTFVTTFMIGHAYTFWQGMYAAVRRIQGRLADLGLILSTHAAREPASTARPGECFAPGSYTPLARDLISLVTRRLALTHVLFWAGVVRQAPGSDRFGVSFNMLLSRPCLAHLVRRGALTPIECDALLSLDGEGASERSRTKLFLCVLTWVTSDLAEAQREGVLRGGAGAELAVLNALNELRAACCSVHDQLAARMPLAYVHFVQVLTDVLCLLAPFALYPRGGAGAVFLSGVVIFFFSGVLELCKSLLDPFGTRRVSNVNFRAHKAVNMGKHKPSGIRAGRKLKDKRRLNLWADKHYKLAHQTAKWRKPFQGASHASGIIVEKVGVETKQPNSGIRKCVRV